MQKVELLAVPGLPMVKAGDDLATLIGERLTGELALRKGDVLVLAQKIVSKAEGRLVEIATVKPSQRAIELAAFRELARETGAWLLVGSLAIKLEAARLANRSFLLGPDGDIAARYDKIHMFDVDLENGESYREIGALSSGRPRRSSRRCPGARSA